MVPSIQETTLRSRWAVGRRLFDAGYQKWHRVGNQGLVRQLASSSKKARDRALDMLKQWLLSRPHDLISEEDLRKIWKGLFYCVWHSDKLPVQTHLINNLSSLIISLNHPLSLRFFQRCRECAGFFRDLTWILGLKIMELIWLEKNSGKISHRQSARSLSIVWGNDDRYWNWVADDNSRFGEVAELKSVCWLEIRGCVDCRLLSANTTYKLSFVVKFSEKRFFGFSAGPVILCVTLPDGQAIKSGRLLQEREGAHIDPEMKVSPLENAQNGWSYLVAGTFLVEHDWTLESSGSPTVLHFSMLETHSGRWKCGLIVDGVQIEPL